MTLYEKIISPKGKVTYREYRADSAALDKLEINNREVVTLFSVFTVSWLKSIQEQIPAHMAIARGIKRVEDSVVQLAGLVACKLDSDVVDVGVEAWNAATKAAMEGLMRVKADG